MKKWKAVIVHPAVTGAAGAVLGAGAICLALFLAVIQPLQKQKTEYQLQSDRLTAACAAVQGELDQTKTDLDKSNQSLQQTTGELDAAKADVSAKQVELDAAKADMSAKQTELENLNREIETARKDLETNQKALDKAKKGVEQLKNLDSLFTAYDRQSNELYEILVNYNDAAANGNYDLAMQYDAQYGKKALELQNTYKSIADLLENFRRGNY